MLKTFAVASGYKQSATAGVSHTITARSPAATPTFSPAAGSYSTVQSVRISDTTSGATIYYTTNGATPAIASPVGVGSITVSTSQTLKAIGAAVGYSQSAVPGAKYTIQ